MTFVVISVEHPDVIQNTIKEWRNWARETIKNFQANEYKDHDASKRERKKMLKAIAKRKIPFWTIIKKGYRNHKSDYVGAVTKLLLYCEITEKDTIIAVDKVEKSKNHMDKHVREIKKHLNMPGLNIYWSISEKEKGIQVCDALAGAVSREYCRKQQESLFEIVQDLLQKEVIKV